MKVNLSVHRKCKKCQSNFRSEFDQITCSKCRRCRQCSVCGEWFDIGVHTKTRCKNCRKTNKGNRWLIFNRDAFCCIYCGKTTNESELSPDHILPLSRGGKNTADNLVSACRECNSAKQNKLLSEKGEKYVREEVRRRNLREGIPPTKKITGSHER